MKSPESGFAKSLIAMTGVFIGLALLLANYFPELLSLDQYLLLIGFIVLVIYLVHLILLKSSRGRPQKFIKVFMIATMVKLVMYLAFILLLAFYYREQAASLLIGFLVLYLCYTTLEGVFLRKYLDAN